MTNNETRLATDAACEAAINKPLDLSHLALPPAMLWQVLLPLFACLLGVAFVAAPWTLDHVLLPFFAAVGSFRLGQEGFVAAVFINLCLLGGLVGLGCVFFAGLCRHTWRYCTPRGLAAAAPKITAAYQERMRDALAARSNPPLTQARLDDISHEILKAAITSELYSPADDIDIYGMTAISVIGFGFVGDMIITERLSVMSEVPPGILLGLIAVVQCLALGVTRIWLLQHSRLKAYCHTKPFQLTRKPSVGLSLIALVATVIGLIGYYGAAEQSEPLPNMQAALASYQTKLQGQCEQGTRTPTDHDLCAMAKRPVETLMAPDGEWLDTATRGLLEFRVTRKTNSRTFEPILRVNIKNQSRYLFDGRYEVRAE